MKRNELLNELKKTLQSKVPKNPTLLNMWT